MKQYIAVTGLHWPDGRGGEKRAEAGESVPAADVQRYPGLLEYVREVEVEE